NILAEAGYEQTYDIDEIITRMPTPAETERLEIPAGTPVAEHIRTGYTAEGQPVRVMVSVIPGDTLILQYTIPTAAVRPYTDPRSAPRQSWFLTGEVPVSDQANGVARHTRSQQRVGC